MFVKKIEVRGHSSIEKIFKSPGKKKDHSKEELIPIDHVCHSCDLLKHRCLDKYNAALSFSVSTNGNMITYKIITCNKKKIYVILQLTDID